MVVNGSTIARVVYAPDNDRMVVVLDRAKVHHRLGERVAVSGPDGAEIGQVSAADLTDPFAAYNPSSPPRRGNHFVLLTLTVKNSGSNPLDADPGKVSLLGDDGYLTSPTTVRRAGETPTPPDFAATNAIAPGSSVTGVISFEEPNGTFPVAVIYSPQSDQSVVIAEIHQAIPADRATPQATAGVGSTGTPSAAAACEGVVDWYKLSQDRFTHLNQATTSLGDLGSATPANEAAVRAAAGEFSSAADAQRAGPVPSAAGVLNTLFAAYFEGQAKSLTYLADALASDDPTQQAVAIGNFAEGDRVFAAGGKAEQAAGVLLTACPELNAFG